MKLQPHAAQLAGLQFGMLTVIAPISRARRGVLWQCECACGNTTYQAYSGDLRSGRISSCGCYRKSAECAERHVTHGHTRGRSRSGAYISWLEMRRRCDDPNRPNYAWYGAKGITYCKEWGDFSVFLADMGERPEGLELDRKDNDGNYTPDNCRWVTHLENCCNRGGKFAA